MSDTVDKVTRSRIMGRVRSKDTGPEVRVRRALFAMGFRYRLHGAKLPGRPDIIFPRRRAVILVHGCLWHWHGCHRSRMPSTNVEYWQAKIARNQVRDRSTIGALIALKWRVLIFWECAATPGMVGASCALAADWLHGGPEATLCCIEPAQALQGANVGPRLRRTYLGMSNN